MIKTENKCKYNNFDCILKELKMLLEKILTKLIKICM